MTKRRLVGLVVAFFGIILGALAFILGMPFDSRAASSFPWEHSWQEVIVDSSSGKDVYIWLQLSRSGTGELTLNYQTSLTGDLTNNSAWSSPAQIINISDAYSETENPNLAASYYLTTGGQAIIVLALELNGGIDHTFFTLDYDNDDNLEAITEKGNGPWTAFVNGGDTRYNNPSIAIDDDGYVYIAAVKSVGDPRLFSHTPISADFQQTVITRSRSSLEGNALDGSIFNGSVIFEVGNPSMGMGQLDLSVIDNELLLIINGFNGLVKAFVHSVDSDLSDWQEVKNGLQDYQKLSNFQPLGNPYYLARDEITGKIYFPSDASNWSGFELKFDNQGMGVVSFDPSTNKWDVLSLPDFNDDFDIWAGPLLISEQILYLDIETYDNETGAETMDIWQLDLNNLTGGWQSLGYSTADNYGLDKLLVTEHAGGNKRLYATTYVDYSEDIILYYDFADEQWHNPLDDNDLLEIGNISDLVIDSLGNLYLSGYFNFDDGQTSEQYSLVKYDGSSWTGLVDHTWGIGISSLVFDSADTLYLGGTFNDTYNGTALDGNLAIYDSSDSDFPFSEVTTLGLRHDDVAKLVVDKNDNLIVRALNSFFINGESHTVIVYNPSTKVITTLGSEFDNAYAYADDYLYDGSQYLYLSTRNVVAGGAPLRSFLRYDFATGGDEGWEGLPGIKGEWWQKSVADGNGNYYFFGYKDNEFGFFKKSNGGTWTPLFLDLSIYPNARMDHLVYDAVTDRIYLIGHFSLADIVGGGYTDDYHSFLYYDVATQTLQPMTITGPTPEYVTSDINASQITLKGDGSFYLHHYVTVPGETSKAYMIDVAANGNYTVLPILPGESGWNYWPEPTSSYYNQTDGKLYMWGNFYDPDDNFNPVSLLSWDGSNYTYHSEIPFRFGWANKFLIDSEKNFYIFTSELSELNGVDVSDTMGNQSLIKWQLGASTASNILSNFPTDYKALAFALDKDNNIYVAGEDINNSEISQLFLFEPSSNIWQKVGGKFSSVWSFNWVDNNDDKYIFVESWGYSSDSSYHSFLTSVFLDQTNTQTVLSSYLDEQGQLHTLYMDRNNQLLYQVFDLNSNQITESKLVVSSSVSPDFLLVGPAGDNIYGYYTAGGQLQKILLQGDEDPPTPPVPPSSGGSSSGGSSSNGGGANPSAPVNSNPAPSEVRDFSVSRLNGSNVQLFWSAPDGTVTDYIVSYGIVGGHVTFGTIVENSEARSFIISDLDPTQEYFFTMAGRNHGATGPFTGQISVKRYTAYVSGQLANASNNDAVNNNVATHNTVVGATDSGVLAGSADTLIDESETATSSTNENQSTGLTSANQNNERGLLTQGEQVEQQDNVNGGFLNWLKNLAWYWYLIIIIPILLIIILIVRASRSDLFTK